MSLEKHSPVREVLETYHDTNESSQSAIRRLERIGTKPGISWRNSAQVILGILLVINTGVMVYLGLHNLPAPGGRKPKQSADLNQAVAVTAAAVETRSVEEILPVTGTIGAWDELKVSPELSGLHVKAIYVEEGDYVNKGQLLAELNSSLLEAQLIQAEAGLKTAEANLSKSIQPNRAEEIARLKAVLEQSKYNALEAKAQNSQDKVKLEAAELLVPRYEKLANAGVVSMVDAEAKRFDRDTAKLELERSRNKVIAAEQVEEQNKQQLLSALHGGRSEDVLITKAGIDDARGRVKHLKEQLAQTKIFATDHGRVLQRNIHIGDTSSSTTPFFIMSRNSRLELCAQVNSDDLFRIHEGQEVSIVSKAKSGKKVMGRVRIVSPQVDPVTRLGKVRIDFPDSSELKSGMFVSAGVILKRETGLTVPLTCVISSEEESHVFVLEGKHAIRRPVQLGLQDTKYVQILSGLKQGQHVVDKGARFLSNGDDVKVSENAEPNL